MAFTIGHLAALALVVVAWVVWTAIYRLYFGPLRHIPGPKLAAISYWYEFYYDIICRGRYLWKIAELHEQYGPIVRINPREVHIKDVDFYDTIYAGGPKHPRNKIRFMATHDESMFDTYDADTHRARRAAMAVSFSQQSIRKLEPTIRATVQQLASRMEALAGSNQVVNLKEMYSGLTMDVIGQYCFGESMDNLKQDKFGKAFLDFFNKMPQQHPIGRMFPLLFDLIQKVPVSFLARLDPTLQPLADYEARISSQINQVLAKDRRTDGVRTVFHEMRDSTHIPDSDKTLERFKAEAAIFLGAGTETTSAALTVISYHLINNPTMLQRLRQELRGVKEEDRTVANLEKLPYLTGLIQEGIRLSFGVPGRLPRVAPKEKLIYAGYVLPPGTVMSESSYLIHTDPTIFSDPFEFQPERWIQDKARLQRCFVPFSRGSRMCIGINLAHAELYLTVATVLSRFDFELHGTSKRDVEVSHDFFVGMPALDSEGVRVKVVKDLKNV